MPKPNANPVNSSGSMLTARNTLGSTMPAPPSSTHPVREHTVQPAPSQNTQVIENSTDGSVNGKYDGLNRALMLGPNSAWMNASTVPSRSPSVMPRSTVRHSI